jgi:hypothetical protein
MKSFDEFGSVKKVGKFDSLIFIYESSTDFVVEKLKDIHPDGEEF